jgi:hypothetical protein
MNKMIIGSALSLCSWFLFTPQQRSEVDLSNFTVPAPEVIQDLSQAIQDVRSISQHAEGEEKLGWGEASNALKQIQTSISNLSKEVGSMRGDLVTSEALEERFEKQKAVYVSLIQEAQKEVETKLSSSSECNCGCKEKLVALEARLLALESKCSGMSLSSMAPTSAPPQVVQSFYPTVSSSNVRSGGSHGSPVQSSYSPVQTSYSQPAVSVSSMPTVSYSDSVVSYGEPTVTYSQPTVSYATSDTVVSQSYYPTTSSSEPSGGCAGNFIFRSTPAVSYSTPTVSYSSPVVSTQYLSSPVASQSVAAAPLRTKEVRVVEKREPRRVTNMVVPDTQTQLSVSQSVPTQATASSSGCYTDANGQMVCPNAASSAPRASSGFGGADGRLMTPFR